MENVVVGLHGRQVLYNKIPDKKNIQDRREQFTSRSIWSGRKEILLLLALSLFVLSLLNTKKYNKRLGLMEVKAYVTS